MANDRFETQQHRVCCSGCRKLPVDLIASGLVLATANCGLDRFDVPIGALFSRP
jgi:hypothetical protein